MAIVDKESLPIDLYTDRLLETRRLKVATVTRQEIQAVRGEYFSASSERNIVSSGDVYYGQRS